MTNLANWVVAFTTIVVISLVIVLHYEVLRACIRFLPADIHRRRQRVVILILVILWTHAIEIWLFALGYYALLRLGGFGTISGIVEITTLLDHAYFSATVYTTVGFGEVYPVGPIRFMTGMEALTGLVMITWSASFTFLEMQRNWPAGKP